MSLTWITLTESLKKGIEFANNTDSIKFPLLLSRIFNAVHRNIDIPFSDEELQKLEISLNLTSDELTLLIDTLLYIVKRSKIFLMKPTVLQDELSEKLFFQAEKAEIFVKFWTENIKLDCDIQNRHKLEKFSWELNLETASDCNTKKAVPMGLLQFDVKDNEDKLTNITVQMNEEQLLKLYNNIEIIQSNLDSLNKV